MQGSKILVAVLVGWFSIETVSAATEKVVCYHGSWSKYRSGNGQFTVSDIDPTLCTHLIYSFVGVNTDGTINILDEYLEVTLGNLASFNNLKQQNPNLKTLIAVGGWSEGSTKYSTVASSSSLRATFIQSALDLVQTYGYDGFDLDWEYPAQRGGSSDDIANYATLLKEFREVFDANGLLLTAAVAAASSSVDLSYDVPSLSQYLDIINVMAYDLHGSYDGVTGQNAPLYASSIDTTTASQLLNVASAIQGWIDRGADPQKLALGLGIYGRSFTLSDSSNTALGASSSGAGTAGPYTAEAGMLGYNEICEKQLSGDWTTVWDDKQKVPYTYNGDQWVGYDNAESITIKVDYAKSLNLGGVMIWSIETEDFRGLCGSKYPLLNAIKSALNTTTTTTSNDTASDDETAADDTATNDETAADDTATNDETAADDTATNDETAADDTATNDETAADDTDTAATDTSTLCTKTGYVRDPNDCSVFYYCMLVGSTYQALSQSCSSGLYFDEDAQTCNWPELVTGC